MSVAQTETRPRVLIADDSKVIRISANKILAGEFDVVQAEDGEEAWERINGDVAIQAVFTDLGMPRLDGYGLLERIRASENQRIRALPVIVVTANEGEEARQDALNRGASDFVSKPFDKTILTARARSHTNLGRMTRKALEMEERVTIDVLTGLGNQRAYVDALKHQRAFSLRHDQPMALLMIELGDNETLVEDLGKKPASSLIKVVANALADGLREEDTAARISTSRYVVVAPACPGAGAESMAHRLLKSIVTARDNETREEAPIRIGAFCPALDKDVKLKEVVQRAEGTLAAAKGQAGDNVVVVADDEEEEATSVLSVDEAVAMLARGQDGEVLRQLPELLKILYPLLGMAGKHARDDLLSLIAQSGTKDKG